jgi:uncharacterized protein
VVKTEAYAKKYMSQYNDPSHDWSHVNRVRMMAMSIAEREDSEERPINKLVVELAALLHDVGDFKFLKEGETGEGILREFMTDAGYDSELQDSICWITQRISYRHELSHPETTPHRLTLELGCVQDADRLEAIGAIGIARCFAYNGSRNFALYDASIEPAVNLTIEKYNMITKSKAHCNARNHFYEKLLKISKMMKTEAGRSEARQRQELLKSFIREFDRECGLNSDLLNSDIYE